MVPKEMFEGPWTARERHHQVELEQGECPVFWAYPWAPSCPEEYQRYRPGRLSGNLSMMSLYNRTLGR